MTLRRAKEARDEPEAGRRVAVEDAAKLEGVRAGEAVEPPKGSLLTRIEALMVSWELIASHSLGIIDERGDGGVKDETGNERRGDKQ